MLFESSQAHVDRQHHLQVTMMENYTTMLELAKSELKVDSSKLERKEKLIGDVISKADKNKKTDNVRQKLSGATFTLEALNLVAYSKVKKALHSDDLKAELTFRGIASFLHASDHVDTKKRNKSWTFMDMNNKLRELEQNRVASETPNDSDAISNSKKGFRPLSSAEFKIPNE